MAVVADGLRKGDREIIVTPEIGLRFGNWLYLWLQAHARTAQGTPSRVLWAPGMDVWLDAFPALAALTIHRREMRFHDRRIWDHDFRFQRFGIDYSAAQLSSFALECLVGIVPAPAADQIVVNVRRGDYYTGDAAQRFGFDQVGYLRAALALAGADRHDGVLVVSDDPEWCQAELSQLLGATAGTVAFAPADPLRNFCEVAGARRIIGSNSTFSYWAAHVATARDPEATVVIMPRFHARLESGTDAYQLDPRWNIVEGFH